jgi:SMC interacting uncharacterized protein involved in chromosome segregation
MDGLDSTIALLIERIKDSTAERLREIEHLRTLHEEKFDSVQTQFLERDVRSRASESAANTAVNAALQAQKEAASAQNEANAAAITKSEAATVKQIDGILALLASSTKATDEKITSINQRLDRGEGEGRGVQQNRTDNHMTIGSVVGILGGALAIFSLGAMVIFGVLNANHASTVVSPAVIPIAPAR